MEEETRIRVMKCIDKGLSRMGGIKNVVYWHFENSFGLSREHIPEKIEEFVGLLKGIYGSGIEIVSFNIVKELEMEFAMKNLPEELDKALKVIEEATLNSRTGKAKGRP